MQFTFIILKSNIYYITYLKQSKQLIVIILLCNKKIQIIAPFGFITMNKMIIVFDI